MTPGPSFLFSRSLSSQPSRDARSRGHPSDGYASGTGAVLLHHGKPHGADGRPLTRFPTVQKHRMFFGSLLPSASTLAPAPGPRSPVPDGASGARVGNGNRTSHHGKPQGIVEGSPLRALPQCKVRCRFPSSQPSRRLFRVPSSQAVPIPVSAYSRVLVVLEQDRTCPTLRVFINIFGKPKSVRHLRKRRWL